MSAVSPGDYGTFGQDVRFGYLDRRLSAPQQFQPKLVLNSPETNMLQTLKSELRRASSFTFSVAFVSAGGIAQLKQALVDFVGVGRIITSDYLGFNSPSAFAELLALRDLGIEVRRHEDGAFHPKGYVFRGPQGITAILGSSNLTQPALVSNHEWNIRVSARRESDLAEQFTNLLDAGVTHSVPLTPEWVEEYAGNWQPPRAPQTRAAASGPNSENALGAEIEPNAMQVAALQSIAALRESGARRGLVISATGTGKTMLAALDVRAAGPQRVLFIAHREQILDRAIKEFRRVLGNSRTDYVKVVGSSKEFDQRFVFSTVQTLSQHELLKQIDPDSFDYVLIDEVHRAAAPSYQRLIDYLNPGFLLGLTATPERTDGKNIFELFDFNVPYEIRLGPALEQEMLAPFHYYGIADFTFDDGTTTSDFTALSRLVEPERVDYVLQAIERYGQAGVAPRGLIFCSRKEEAQALSRELNLHTFRGRVLRTAALTGDDDVATRERRVQELEAGELDYILTVDIFNEGVDIPSINQVIMLRQTQSSIIFVQQLGRGLRHSPGKEYVVVIDFIGNYANNYLIPIALFGDDSLNKESIRRSLVAAEERGAVAGLSSIQFDRIAQERVLRSLATTKLDAFPNLKAAIETVGNRVGRTPRLEDFLHFESADPTVLATRLRNYPALISKLFKTEHDLSTSELNMLTVISNEVLIARRLHEAVLLKALLGGDALSLDRITSLLRDAGLPYGGHEVDSAVRSLTLDFNTQPEQSAYVNAQLAEQADDGVVRASPSFLGSYGASAAFRAEVDDLLRTTIRLVVDRYDLKEPFTRARQYSRKDASRLLGWRSNMSSTIYGYRVDKETQTCPIFVTLHKSDEVSASTAYEDALVDSSTLLWYTRSRRTMASAEVRAIVDNAVELHVFAKKDDADGKDFYYLGRSRAENAEDTTMRNGDSVVQMHLCFDQPIDPGVYNYFHPTATA
ncbi:DEAD/DEAH box helicase [Parafrigoribacterium humi]|uniref:DEAD/DEAH box helicase n=1 Tax=Parafrigoribacterium humi TaxID=3144664 RepID=UPI0032EC9527